MIWTVLLLLSSWNACFGIAWVFPCCTRSPSRRGCDHQPSKQHGLWAVSPVKNSEDYFSSLLRQFGFDRTLHTFRQQDLPRLAEVYIDGKTAIARLVSFRCDSSENGAEPLVEIELLGDDEHSANKIIDFGQITTIWETDNQFFNVSNVNIQLQLLPEEFVDRKLDLLYKSRVGRARSSSKGLTKKQIADSLQHFPEPIRSHADNVLRKVIKVGNGLSRLVDSGMARQYLYGPTARSGLNVFSLQQACAAYALCQDSKLGGRFKRWPCVFVDRRDDDNSVSIINGGWLVVDQSVRAGTEARKFATRGTTQAGTTIADERIIRRLECLAMGELMSRQDGDLELDVREALQNFNLPLNPDGAKEALTRIGRWTVGDKASGRVLFWPKPVLEAAAWYVQRSKQRRLDATLLMRIEDRVDLTKLPCICIDAERVAFRDDAIGIRLRSSTGRRLKPEASKWEILIHIADASDIYVSEAVPDDPMSYMQILREAAESRGVSRYDLPSGPLHLLPPVVLQELSLSSHVATGNRCVTLWVYIDERDGKLLDSGVERTLTAPVSELSFSEATAILEGSSTATTADTKQLKAVLLVVERNLQIWSERRKQRSEVAQKREERLLSKQISATALYEMRDDGSDGFLRTRGHRVIDAALDLYTYAVAGLMRRSDAPIPRARGADASRAGRVATSPLRRFIDGLAQRQILAVCCDLGQPMTLAETREAGKNANVARNELTNVRAVRKQRD